VLLFTGAVSMLTGLLIGVVPAFRGTTKAPASHLGRGRQGTDAVRGGRLRGALVVAQVAFSIVLLVVSGLFLRSLVRVNSVELGFDPDRLLAARLSISQVDYPTPAAQREFFASVLEQVSALPGVLSASAASKLPIQGRATDWGVWRADRPKPERGQERSYLARWVYPRYLETMRIPLRRGREISPRDVEGAPQVVVLSESAVRDLFGDEDPIGSPVVIWGRSGTYEVVGVAADAVLESALNGPRGAFYIPAAQMGATGLRLVVRTSGAPTAVTAAVRDVVRRVGRDALMSDDRPMRAVVDEALDSFRIVIVSLSVFAVVALGLAAVGLYGALAYHVSQQQHELGVRMAVGASRGRVLALVARRGGVLTGVGMALGLAGATAGTRLVRTQLFDTAPLDPASYVGAAVLFVLVAAVACGVPAWRATRIDPVTVLRV
jgi:predicted permease